MLPPSVRDMSHKCSTLSLPLGGITTLVKVDIGGIGKMLIVINDHKVSKVFRG